MTPAPAKRLRLVADLIKPHARQRAFLEALATHHYVLYGGAAGGGKSYILRWALIYLLLEWFRNIKARGVRVGLFSKDYPTLHDRQLSKVRVEFPGWLGTYHEQRREFELASGFGGGVICFRNLDDPSKYKSSEFAAIAVEELTEIEELVFDLLRFRLRWPGIEEPKFLGATNPTGIGHAFVKRLWIQRVFPPNLVKYAGWFTYVPAKMTDNPHISANYHDQLNALPDSMRAALRDGSWDVFTGQVFSEFRYDLHTCDPFHLPSWWSRWRANDPGYSDPSTWGWFAADGDGRVYVYREATFRQMVPSEQARAVVSVSKRWDDTTQRRQVPESFECTVTGMDAFVARDRAVGKSDADYYREGGIPGLTRPIHGPGSRGQRAKTVHEYLRPGAGGKPRVQIFRPGVVDGIEYGCPKLIETLPSLVNNPHDPEAVLECDADHWYDYFSYGLARHHTTRSIQPAKVLPTASIGHLLGHDEPPMAEDDG